MTLTAPDFQPQPVGPDGLRRQRILLSNRYCASVPGTRIFIRGLPAGVEVYNASEQLNDGTWVLDLPPFASPLAAREITLEYFAAPGSPDDFFPSIYSSSATVIAPATPAIFAIERIRHRAGGLVIATLSHRIKLVRFHG